MFDLEKYHATTLIVSGSIRVEDIALVQELAVQYEPKWPKRATNLYGLQIVDGHFLHPTVYLGLERLPHRQQTLRFLHNVHPVSKELLGSRKRRMQDEANLDRVFSLLDGIGQLKLEFRLTGSMEFTYEPDSAKTLVSLPMMSSGDPSSPFSALVGVRFVKYDGRGDQSITLDLMKDRSLKAGVRFPFGQPITRDIGKQAAGIGYDIIKQFVSETGGYGA